MIVLHRVKFDLIEDLWMKYENGFLRRFNPKIDINKQIKLPIEQEFFSINLYENTIQ